MLIISTEKYKPITVNQKFEKDDRLVMYVTDSDRLNNPQLSIDDLRNIYHNFYGIVAKTSENGIIEEVILFLKVPFLEFVMGIDAASAQRENEDNIEMNTFGYRVKIEHSSDAILANIDKTLACVIYKTIESEEIDRIFGEEQVLIIHGSWKEND